MTDVKSLETQVQEMINQKPQLPNMPHCFIWGNENVSVHHHYAKEKDHENTKPEQPKRPELVK